MIQFKRSATFAFTATYTPEPGDPENLLGATIASQVRQGDRLLASVPIELAEDGLSFSGEAATDDWPLGPVRTDIRIELPGTDQVLYTKTIEFEVVREVTRP